MIHKEEVLDALNSAEGFKRFYSLRLTLINNGNQVSAICPFHDDKKPSLSINLVDGKFNCFGCGKSGDIFTFRMLNENIDFEECIKRFASEYNISHSTLYEEKNITKSCKNEKSSVMKNNDGSNGSVKKNDFLLLLQNEKNIRILNSSQDYANGKMYYAVSVDNTKYIISSDKKVFKFAGAAENDFILTSLEPDLFRFSEAGIIKFMQNENHETPFELFEMIKKYIGRYIFLKKKEAYTLLALWVMGTYLYRLFRYYPYIHLNAEKGSGKTLLMEILAPLCFNGQISVNSTEAVIFRDIQNNSPTMFLDELEKMGKEDKEKFAGIMSVLKTGFSKNGLVKRCDGKNKDKIRSFSTYAPKMFAGIKDIDDVLADRTIKIKMYRKLKNELFERYSESKDTIETQKYIRDALYLFGLSYASQIEKLYNEPGYDESFCMTLSNRELDIWLPLFTLAHFIDTCNGSMIQDEISEYSKTYTEEKRTFDNNENDTIILLGIINRFIQITTPDVVKEKLLYYKSDTLFEYFKSQDEFKWLDSKCWLTRQLKKIEIKSDTFFLVDKSIRGYVINKEILSDYSSRYC